MSWSALALYSWLTIAWLPSGGVTLYDNPLPEVLELGGSFYSELGAEVTWGFLFAGGSVRVPMWWDQGSCSFFPFQLESTIDAGVKFGGLRLGWTHTCAHAVVPDLGAVEWLGRQVLPRWDSAYDAIYLRFEAGKR